jgi:hypothetical protein
MTQAETSGHRRCHGGRKDAVKNTASMSIGENIIPAILLGPVVAKNDKVKKTVVKDAFQNLEMIQTSLPKEKCTE